MLTNITTEELNERLADTVYQKIAGRLSARRRSPGRLCMRVTTLPLSVMHTLCARFAAAAFPADVVLVLPQRQRPQHSWEVSATKLIELRNKNENRPLVAFVPPGIKVAAEDSFDVSTFVEFDLSGLPHEIADAASKELPDDLRKEIAKHLLPAVRAERQVNDDDMVRYYLTILKNECTPQAAGGATYHLKMVPDFALFDRADIKTWVQRNLKAVATLRDSSRPLLARIHDLRLQPNTLQHALYEYLRSVSIDQTDDWANKVAVERPDLAFDRWQFEGEVVESEKLRLYVDDLSLPVSEDVDNLFYVDVKRTKTLRISWETNPRPQLANGLSHFRLEIVSSDGNVVWEGKNIPVGPSARAQRSSNLKVESFSDRIEDGIYFVRVMAYSQSGESVCIAESRDPTNPDGKRINETADIWFWIDDKAEPPPAEPQRNVAVNSFLDAKLQVQFATFDRSEDPFSETLRPVSERTGWSNKKDEKRAESVYNIVYDAQARFTLTVSTILRQIEAEILANPQNVGLYQIKFRSRSDYDVAVRPTSDIAPKEFLQARSELFQSIRNEEKDGSGITATVDLGKFEQLIIFKYANAYHKWLNRQFTPLALDIDTVEVIVPGESGRPVSVFLMAPTHPLRLLWHLQRGRVARDWLENSIRLGRKLTKAQQTYLRELLAPINFPSILQVDGKHYTEQGALTPFWGLYLAEGTTDNRALRARVQRYLTIGHQDFGALGDINKDMLLTKLQDFLSLYSYISTFKINIFNPGDAAPIVDAILEIERVRRSAGLPSLSYELRLFTSGKILQDIGEAIDDLRNPERQVSAEADDFTIRSRNHLFPKLRYSKNTVQEFLESPRQYEAHISLLHDFFAAKVAFEPREDGRSSFVHGLVQEPVTFFRGDRTELTEYQWVRQLIPAQCPEIASDKMNASQGLASALDHIMKAQVKAADAPTNSVPSLTVTLSLEDKSLLYRIHDVSHWVITFDRYLGFDYFDSASSANRPVYLLDFRPEFSTAESYRLLLTTRSSEEFFERIRDAFKSYGFEIIDDAFANRFLQVLRSISGRLCFKLMSGTSAGELLGLASASLWLRSQRQRSNRILIPLDSHSDLFSGLGDGDSAQRADLLYVAFNASKRVLVAEVVEVKWRRSLGDVAYQTLCTEEIESQLDNTMKVLRRYFDPNYEHIDGVVHQKVLISLLLFYIERAIRYNLISDEVGARLSKFCRSLDTGYELVVHGLGLVFDLSFKGEKHDTFTDELTFVRIGRDRLEALYSDDDPRDPFSDEEPIPNQQMQLPWALTDDQAPPQSELTPEAASVEMQPGLHADPLEISPDITNLTMPTSGDSDAKGNSEKIPQPQTAQTMRVPDVVLGETQVPAQFGILGRMSDKTIALDLNGTNTISLFGVQGGGKSYTLGGIVEMATQVFPNVSRLSAPLASVIFHYHESQDYPPEFVSMKAANDREDEIAALRQLYDAEPGALKDILLLTSADKLDERRAEFPGVEIVPIAFASKELQARDWLFLMGTGNQMYMKLINMIMRQLRGRLTLDSIREEVQNSGLSDSQKQIAIQRLYFAGQFIDDSSRLSDLIRPGRLLIVDLRDEFVGKDEALGLFVVMLNIFANASRDFNKLIVFDEAHKYMNNQELAGQIVDTIRQMRHQGVSILLASQDPASLPEAIIELSTVLIMHRFNSPRWLKRIQKSIVALADLTPEKMTALRPGEAYVWAARATETIYTQRAMKITIRPRVTLHGGATLRADRQGS